MATKEFVKAILKHIEANATKIQFNNKMFEISEGDLLKYVEIALKEQLSPNSAYTATHRAAPINVWNKLNSKLSTLYNKPVTRTTELTSDQDLISYYEGRGINKHFGELNLNYNQYKWSTIEIFEDETEEALRFRSIPSNQFLVYSDDEIDPLRVTALIKFMGQVVDAMGVTRNKYWIYTANEFISILDDETIVNEDMFLNQGVNPFGVIPMEYVNMSKYLLVPMPDRDSLQMTVLFPVLFSDQNFASLYLSFPLIYVVDGDGENLPASPDMFWNLKSDKQDKTANVGVVKASPDLQAQMEHTIGQLSIWMDSRDVKPGTVGKLTAENWSSGVSKFISEADTTENRKQQEIVFKEVERKFWKRLAAVHNTLADVGRIENRQRFSEPEDLEVSVEYAQDTVIETRSDKVNRLKNERDAGFTTTRRALKELNPDMDDKLLDQLVADILEERTVVVEEVVEDE